MPQVNLTDLETQGMRLLVYGAPGVGKTYFVASAVAVPEMRPVFIADFESGLASVRDQLKEHWDPAQVTVWSIQDEKDLGEIAKAITSRKYRTVVIDGLTEMQELLLKLVLAKAGKAGGQPTFDHRNKVNAAMKDMLRAAIAIKTVHLLCTAGEKVFEIQLTESLVKQPDLTRSMSNQIPRYFDMVAYLSTQSTRTGKSLPKIQRVLQLQPYDDHYAKDRLSGGRLGPAVMDATMEALYGVLFQGKGIPVVLPGEDGESNTTEVVGMFDNLETETETKENN